MPSLFAFAHAWFVTRRPARGDRGQATIEYALVLVVAAAVGIAAARWITTSDVFGKLFESVINKIKGQIP